MVVQLPSFSIGTHIPCWHIYDTKRTVFLLSVNHKEPYMSWGRRMWKRTPVGDMDVSHLVQLAYALRPYSCLILNVLLASCDGLCWAHITLWLTGLIGPNPVWAVLVAWSLAVLWPSILRTQGWSCSLRVIQFSTIDGILLRNSGPCVVTLPLGPVINSKWCPYPPWHL